jgi:sigma-B regulation protein RsbU (phosphoserine phosphatase)
MLISASIAAVVMLGVFLYLVQSGWFARMKRGFLTSLILAVAGIAFISASLLGVWAWITARDILFQQVIRELHQVGDAAHSSLTDAMSLVFGELTGDAREIAERLSEKHPDDVADELEIIVESNNRLLQADVFDPQGQLLAERSSTAAKEPIRREAVAYAVRGQQFISDVYFSTAFNRYILYLATPIFDENHVIRGALTSRYDFQSGLESTFKDVRFGQSGYAVLVGNDGRVIAHPSHARIRDDISSYAAVQKALAGQTGWVRAKNNEGVDRLFFYRPFQSPATVDPKPLAILTEIDENEALSPVRAASFQFFFGVGVLTLLGVVAAYAVSSSMVQPIDALNDFAKKVESGELTTRLDLRHRDEIGRLAASLNQMVSGLQERDKLREAAITTQQLLQVARQIQMGLLPRNFPAFSDSPEIDIYGMLRPALEVGGDLYDFFRLDEHRICFVIGDVSDKGVPAALFMAMVLTSFEISAMTSPGSIARVLRNVNRFLIENNDSQMFVTLFAGVLDLRNGRIDYCDGGHEPPFLVRRGSGVEMLEKKGGIALGVFDDFDFQTGTIFLQPGDSLVLYTDGVNEAMNGDRQLFSTPAIADTLRTVHSGNAAAGICETVITSVDAFVKDAPQSDDITLLIIRYCGAEGAQLLTQIPEASIAL